VSQKEEFDRQLSQSILIGGYQEEQQLLLVPISESEWECLAFCLLVVRRNKISKLSIDMEEVLTRLKEGFFDS
jgi:hypothetical protein